MGFSPWFSRGTIGAERAVDGSARTTTQPLPHPLEYPSHATILRPLPGVADRRRATDEVLQVDVPARLELPDVDASAAVRSQASIQRE